MSAFILFFFQAEDGIRDHCVTGVQTCALPISLRGVRCHRRGRRPRFRQRRGSEIRQRRYLRDQRRRPSRSEERRVGKECRYRWRPEDTKKNLNNLLRRAVQTVAEQSEKQL